MTEPKSRDWTRGMNQQRRYDHHCGTCGKLMPPVTWYWRFRASITCDDCIPQFMPTEPTESAELNRRMSITENAHHKENKR